MLRLALPLALSIACKGKDETEDSQRPDDSGALPCPGNRPYETFYPDDDADGYGRTDDALEACQPAPEGYALRPDDCDDTNPDAHPDGQEDCATAFDDDCNGTINQPAGVNLLNCTHFFVDTDADAFGNADDSVCLCEPDKTHTASAPGDCDDRDPKVHLGTPTCVALEEKVWTAQVEGTDIGEYVFAAELDEVAGDEIVIGSPDANGDAGALFLLRSTSTGTIDLVEEGHARDPDRRRQGRAPRERARGSRQTHRNGSPGRARVERRLARRGGDGLRGGGDLEPPRDDHGRLRSRRASRRR
jgi:hypothetical protein